MDSLLVKAEQAAEILGISRTLFYRLLRSGRLPLKPIKLTAKKVLYSVLEIREYVQAGCPDRQAWERIQKGDKE